MGARTPLSRQIGPALIALAAGALTGAAASPAMAGSGGTTNSSGSSSCGCGAPTTHQVTVPGVNITPPQINIGLPSIGVGVASASASGVGTASASATAETNVSISVSTSSSGSSTAQNNAAALVASGGGGGSWGAEGGVTTDITDIKIETPPAPPPAAPICLAWKAAIRQVAIQAICLDDKAAPHPASQVSPERAVAPGYEGEVFRCIAGSRMQYTVADFSGQADFNHGQTLTCQKGEALYHGANGALQCRPQAPARDCNERSLLRRFGAGIKLMTLSGARVCAAWSGQSVAAAPAAPAGPMVLN